MSRCVLRVVLPLMAFVSCLQTPVSTDARNGNQIEAARHPCACPYNSAGNGAKCGVRSASNEGIEETPFKVVESSNGSSRETSFYNTYDMLSRVLERVGISRSVCAWLEATEPMCNRITEVAQTALSPTIFHTRAISTHILARLAPIATYTIEPRLITKARTATVELVTVVHRSRGKATAVPIRSYRTIHEATAVTVVHRSRGKATAVPIRSYRTIHEFTAIPVPSVFAHRHITG